MKTRIIKTRMWTEDEKFAELHLASKLSFLYFITNSRIGMTGIYECPDRTIKFEVGLSTEQLSSAKNELIRNNIVLFHNGYVCVVNAEKHNRYRNSPDNEKAYQKEKACIPSSILEFFKSSDKSSVEGTVYSNKKYKVRNKKLKTINKKYERYLQKWNKIHNTNYSSISGVKDNLDKWLKEYSYDDICLAIEKVKQHSYWKNKMTPIVFLRTKNPRGEAVDYIGEMLNFVEEQREVVSVK